MSFCNKESTPINKRRAERLSKSDDSLQNNCTGRRNLASLSASLEAFHFENQSNSDYSIEISIVDESSSSTKTSDEFFCHAGDGTLNDGDNKDRGLAEKSFDGSKESSIEVCCMKKFEQLQKEIDRLSGLLQEQNRNRNDTGSTDGNQVEVALKKISDFVEGTVFSGLEPAETEPDAIDGAAGRFHSASKTLLDALESRKTSAVELIIKNALTKFLQSKFFREQMLSATSASVSSALRELVGPELSAACQSLLNAAQRDMLQVVTAELGAGLKDCEKSSKQSCAELRRQMKAASGAVWDAVSQHQQLVEGAMRQRHSAARDVMDLVKEVLQNELSEWRKNLMEDIQMQRQCLDTPFKPNLSSITTPSEPNASDQLLSAAEINIKFKDGDLNGSFEKALLASDLAQVTAACRAADPALVFAPPCQLAQSVLLSLAQQLSTDMLQETQLKCRYLEDALMNFNVHDPVTRSHLPKVIGEVSSNLTSFLRTFPNHMYARQIKMLVMAAQSVMKE